MRVELAYTSALIGAAGLVALAAGFTEAPATPRRLGEPVARATSVDPSVFVNFETPHVHPLDLTPDRSRLLAVNTAAGTLEVFGVVSGMPRHSASIPVGVDPVSVRARTNSEAWVVNHISDTVSVVDLDAGVVRRTIATNDEPADVAFAGAGRAFVTCSQVNTVQVFDALAPGAPIAELAVDAEDPRALTVSPDGGTVYAAVFESGNGSTILGGGITLAGLAFPPNVVNEATTPYGGVNPPPNDGGSFLPAQKPGNPNPPAVGMIVQQDIAGNWMDDNGGDWTDLVSGPNAALSGRPVGWELLDHDVVVIDATSLSVSYVDRLMNINMAIGVNPATGDVAVVGTEATNATRFEPNLNGRFVRVHGAVVPAGGGAATVADLNPHLTYPDGPVFAPIAQDQRDRSLGDPRGIAFTNDGSRAYVTGMGSNNVGVFDGALSRTGPIEQIDVGQGPTGIALDESRSRLYTLNRFDGTISTVDTSTHTHMGATAFFDPTPDAIKAGRPFLYDTHLTSGLGQLSCASCHVDSRFDRVAWDLGNPAGDMTTFDQNCQDGGCEDWHPMKGPMSTQTLQDIIGKEPHHWRSDRFGLEEFDGAFHGLLGDDAPLGAPEMQLFEGFLATIHFPPNPFRSLDNTLPQNLALDGHFTIGRFAPAGQPLPDGNPLRGLFFYRTANLDGVECVTCHTLPTGMGTNFTLQGLNIVDLPPGPMGELHHMTVSVDGSTNISIKVPQIRNMHEKTGFNTTRPTSTAGFGYLHDGSVDSIERFVGEPVFQLANIQQFADVTAFMLAFSGSDLPTPGVPSLIEPPGPTSQDAHAAVGWQATLDSALEPADMATIIAESDLGDIGLTVKGLFNGELRGFVYTGAGNYQSDRAAEVLTHAQLLAAAAPGAELTWTVVPTVTATRIGVDKDTDGFFDRDELDACADDADALSTPLNSQCCPVDLNGDGIADNGDINEFIALFLAGDLSVDFNGDGLLDNGDINEFIALFLAGC